MQKYTYHMSKKPEISLQTFEVGLVMAAVMMRVTAVTLIIPFPVAPSAMQSIDSDYAVNFLKIFERIHCSMHYLLLCTAMTVVSYAASRCAVRDIQQHEMVEKSRTEFEI